MRVYHAPERDLPWINGAEDDQDTRKKKRRERSPVQERPLPTLEWSDDVDREIGRPLLEGEHSFLAFGEHMAAVDSLAHSSKRFDMPASFRPRSGPDHAYSDTQLTHQDLPPAFFSQDLQTGGHAFDYSIPGPSRGGKDDAIYEPTISPVLTQQHRSDPANSQMVHSMAGTYDAAAPMPNVDSEYRALYGTDSGRQPDQLGCYDPRQNIVTKGLLPNEVAVRLVEL